MKILVGANFALKKLALGAAIQCHETLGEPSDETLVECAPEFDCCATLTQEGGVAAFSAFLQHSLSITEKKDEKIALARL
jgi:hypothetical protein